MMGRRCQASPKNRIHLRIVASPMPDHAKNLARFSNDKPGCDQVAAAFALDAVISFLRSSPSNSPSDIIGDRRKRFKILDELRQALLDLSEGSAPAPMLRPQGKNRGRRADVSSPKLASVISRQPISAGMVEEWLDRFGGQARREKRR